MPDSVFDLWEQWVECELPTPVGDFKMRVYRPKTRCTAEPIVLYKGNLEGEHDVLVRLHSECMTGEVFGSQKCDCAAQLAYAQQRIAYTGKGIVIYLRQEGRGIGLFNKIRAYAEQDVGENTITANEKLGFPVDARTYEWAIAILKHLRVSSIRLLTNNPLKRDALAEGGICIAGVDPVVVGVSKHNLAYLTVKRDLMGHTLVLEMERNRC